MPGRATELILSKVRNLKDGIRNIYIFYGRLMFLTAYAKSKALTNYAFYVARFLPLYIG